jgi:hypothetical protein
MVLEADQRSCHTVTRDKSAEAEDLSHLILSFTVCRYHAGLLLSAGIWNVCVLATLGKCLSLCRCILRSTCFCDVHDVHVIRSEASCAVVMHTLQDRGRQESRADSVALLQ